MIWHIACLWKAVAARPPFKDVLRQMLIPTAAALSALLAVLINPRGAGVLTYVLAMARDPVSQQLGTERISLSFRALRGAIFLTGLLLSSLLLMRSPRRPTVFESLVYLVLGVLGLQMIRAGIWFGLFMAPVVAAHLEAVSATRRAANAGAPPQTAGRPGFNYAILALLIIGAACSTPWLKGSLPLPQDQIALVTDGTPAAGGFPDSGLLVAHRFTNYDTLRGGLPDCPRDCPIAASNGQPGARSCTNYRVAENVLEARARQVAWASMALAQR